MFESNIVNGRKEAISLAYLDAKNDLCSRRQLINQMCQKGFVKFHANNFLLNNAPCFDGPVYVDSNQMMTMHDV